MLRIGPQNQLPMAPQGGAPNAMPPTPPVPPQAAPDAPGKPARPPKYSAEKVPQDIAKYLDPDCRCNNCEFYNGDGTCHVVDGKVDPQGVCSLHTCAHDQDPDQDGDDDSGQPAGQDDDSNPSVLGDNNGVS